MSQKRKSSNRHDVNDIKKSKSDQIGWETLPVSDLYREPWHALGSWFIGPRSENKEQFKGLVNKCLDWLSQCREDFFPTDPCYINEDVKSSKAYRSEMQDTEEKLHDMLTELKDCIPFFSPRYQGHMTWETTMPSTLGYLAGMLWNQNNVDSAASPVTTLYELTVGSHLCQLMNFDTKTVQPWAHLTGCGSVANIEAMWAARNLKFHPISTKAVVMDKNAGDLKGGADFPVYIPKRGEKVKLKDCSNWELLNLQVDAVCTLTEDVIEFIDSKKTKKTLKSEFDHLLKSHSVVSIGLHEFMERHQLKKTPVICSTGTSHYSWPKGATLLGLGDQNVISIHVDVNARQNTEILCQELDKCVKHEIPVLMVVAVIGSTEESAVDPLAEIINIRDKYCGEKGLNFVVHADAAWGGYMLTMLKKPEEKFREKRRNQGEDFVPYIPLSDYAEHQYRAIRHADTVTIDPHKTGLCQYPAGALAYRNGTMKGFITLEAPEVFHGENEVSVGVYGLEGSKPGAAAAGVLLSHRVIGLDQFGYGRILGQSQFSAKLFYCLWATVAEDYDEFICMNLIDFPPKSAEFPYNNHEAKIFIRENILAKDNRDLMKKKVQLFLKQVGPDALINTFVVNFKNQSNTSICNKLNDTVYQETSSKVGESPKRTCMFLTASIFEQQKYGKALTELKKRLGLSLTDESLSFLRNTSMNPFQGTEGFVTKTGELFRNAVLNSIGAVNDARDHHSFVVVNVVENDGKVFVDYMPCFESSQCQYHVVATMKLNNDNDIQLIRKAQQHSKDKTLIVQSKSKMTMMELLRTGESMDFSVFRGEARKKKLFEVRMVVDEIYRFNHLETMKASKHLTYPSQQTYFMYGDEKNAFISHVITKFPSFHQVVQLDTVPHSVPLNVLDYGVLITIPDIIGSPLIINNTIVDPLQSTSYAIRFKGKQQTECSSEITFNDPHAKKWFDSELLNAQTMD